MIKYYLAPEAIQSGCKFEAPNLGDAGYDIYASQRVTISHGSSQWIPTGLHLEIPSMGLYSRVGLIRDRSSVAARGLFTHAGVIDSSFRGEVKILLSNFSHELLDITIRPGEKIAQMIIVQHLSWPTQRVDYLDELSSTERGSAGFGSTGK